MLDKGWLLIYLAKRGRLSDDYDKRSSTGCLLINRYNTGWDRGALAWAKTTGTSVRKRSPAVPCTKMPVETKHIFKKAPSPVFGPPHLCPRSVIAQSQSDHWIRTAACRHYFPVTLWNENMQLPACDLPSFRWHQYWVEEPLPKVGHGMWLDHADSDSVYLDHHLGSLIFESYLHHSGSLSDSWANTKHPFFVLSEVLGFVGKIQWLTLW